MAFNWDEVRAMMIRAHGIRRADDKFAFFYDETNNIRKLTLTEDGTIVPERNNFVLGGVVLEEGRRCRTSHRCGQHWVCRTMRQRLSSSTSLVETLRQSSRRAKWPGSLPG